jgi:hypothetical protein
MPESELLDWIGLELDGHGGVRARPSFVSSSSLQSICFVQFNFTQTHRVSVDQQHNPLNTKSSLSMALPKRIIKETERLMAEPYVYPSQTVAAMP